MTKLKFIHFKVFVLSILFTQASLAQVDAESRFYTETFNNGVNRNIITDYGAIINDGQDDSQVLTTAINDVSSRPNGGKIYFPAGTYHLKFVHLKSNVHLVFHKNAVVKLPPNDNPWGAIFWIGNRETVQNVSIRGDGGRFTIDVSDAEFSEICIVAKVENVKNFLIDNVHVIENYTQQACFVFGRGHNGGYPEGGILKNLDVIDAEFGYGLVQIGLGSKILFKNIQSTGGICLRLEPADRELTGAKDIVGRNITCTNGNSAVMLSPHSSIGGTINVHGVKSVGCSFGVRIERGFGPYGDGRGRYANDSRVTGILAEYGTNAQVRSDHFLYLPCELKNVEKRRPINWEVSNGWYYDAVSIAPVIYDQGDGDGFYKVEFGQVGFSGFRYQPKVILNSITDKIPDSQCNNSSSNFVTIRKGNASNFAIDGGNGGTNGQNVHLWAYNQNNVNQQWEEINRGNGFYSYKKRNTNFCIDGNNGGSNGQNIHLWTCNNGNQNQHFRKVSLGNNRFRLEKRNASNVSIDGLGGGANAQNVQMGSSNNNSGNQQWIITRVNTAKANKNKLAIRDGASLEKLKIYPNPTKGLMRISGFNNLVSSIKVLNSLGQVIMESSSTESPKNEMSINVSRLQSGVYWVVAGSQTSIFVKE